MVSPLIALMQDQVAQLEQMGIPAAVLNSSQKAGEQSAILRKAKAGAYRLLYLSPERLARPDTLELVARRADFLFRDRRSALYFGVGARISAGVSATAFVARAFSDAAHCGIHRQCDATGAP